MLVSERNIQLFAWNKGGSFPKDQKLFVVPRRCFGPFWKEM